MENKFYKDAVGVRIICSYIDDIYTLVDLIKQYSEIRIINEKDGLLGKFRA